MEAGEGTVQNERIEEYRVVFVGKCRYICVSKVHKHG